MITVTTIKRALRPILPRKVRKVASEAFNWREILHYYLPYVLHSDGRAWAPRKVTLETTYRCNLTCPMCPQANEIHSENSGTVKKFKTMKEMTGEQMKRIVDQAAEMGVERLLMTGGELFLRPDALDVLTHARRKGLLTSIVTNATRIDDRIARGIVDCGLDVMTVSLDGPQEINDIVRGRGVFEKACRAVREITAYQRETGKTNPLITLSCTISAQNQDHLVELIDIAEELGVNLSYSWVFYTTRAVSEETKRLLPMIDDDLNADDQDIPVEIRQVDAAKVSDAVDDIVRESGRATVQVQFDPFMTREEVRQRYADDNYSFVNKCFYPWYEMRISPYGTVYPCPLSVPLGNVLETPLKDIWNSPKSLEFRRELRRHKLLPACKKCCKLTQRTWSALPTFGR